MTTADDPAPAPNASTAIERPSGEQLRRAEEAFLAARGEATDTDWAELAFARLVFADVQVEVAEQLLTGAAQTLAEAQEAPSALWGAPGDWADEQVAELRASGVDVFDDSLLMGPRESVLTAFGLAAGLAALFFVAELISLLIGDDLRAGLSIGLAIAPLLLGALLVATITVYKRALGRFSFPVTILLCALTVAAGAAVAANVMIPLGGVRLGVPSLLVVVMVPVYAGLAWVIGKVWPKPAPAPAPPITAQQILEASRLGDEQWLSRARGALRRRGDLTGSRIDSALAEAGAHAADGDSSLVGEFGAPEDFARSLPADPRTAPRRLTLLYSALVVLWPLVGLIGLTDPDWTLSWSQLIYPALMIICACLAVQHARDWRRAAQA
ncbi:hypothetical protein [Brachybacterium kimchii]|uniref:DUF1129 domain-containing protein n=1 Tax=Brachybacterium kimchii TaxID=2942909 RepID=A0ABY4N0X2_9MICO|nr:hypothetical protein [Brachybacterium kimchii]UQN28202.1 hypothetical protein M4486_11125 [Brachybacterium kimchii]